MKEHLDELKIGASEKPDDEEKVYQTNLEQRVTFYCVPIPGENDWTRNVCIIVTKLTNVLLKFFVL